MHGACSLAWTVVVVRGMDWNGGWCLVLGDTSSPVKTVGQPLAVFHLIQWHENVPSLMVSF
jgi:hypothetical protein